MGRAIADPILGIVIEDPNDPKFDLEAYLKHNVDDNVDHQP